MANQQQKQRQTNENALATQNPYYSFPFGRQRTFGQELLAQFIFNPLYNALAGAFWDWKNGYDERDRLDNMDNVARKIREFGVDWVNKHPKFIQWIQAEGLNNPKFGDVFNGYQVQTNEDGTQIFAPIPQNTATTQGQPQLVPEAINGAAVSDAVRRSVMSGVQNPDFAPQYNPSYEAGTVDQPFQQHNLLGAIKNLEDAKPISGEMLSAEAMDKLKNIFGDKEEDWLSKLFGGGR